MNYKPFEHLYQYLKRTDVRLFDVIKKVDFELSRLWQRGFYSVGDIKGYSFVTADFIIDNSWHVLDLTPFVPTGTKAVLATLMFTVDSLPAVLYLRRHGNAFDYNTGRITVPTLTIQTSYQDVIVDCDDRRRIEYFGLAGPNWLTLNLTVRGYWI